MKIRFVDSVLSDATAISSHPSLKAAWRNSTILLGEQLIHWCLNVKHKYNTDCIWKGLSRISLIDSQSGYQASTKSSPLILLSASSR